MTPTASIDLRVLSALAICVSTEETRYYLNGVKLEIRPRHVTYIVTDGHRLVAHRCELDAEALDNTLVGDFIIPSAQCKAMKVGKRDLTETAELTGDKARLSIEYNGAAVSFAPIDGAYPDWRRVVPSAAPSGEVAHFNPKYLADFVKVGLALGYGQTPWVAHNGEAPASVTWANNVNTVAVLMPIRRPESSKFRRPAWLDAPQTDHAKAA